MADQRDLARQLLRRASDDHAAAAALLDMGAVSDAIVGFHAQQAVEKALKAVLAASRIDFPFSHDLKLLSTLCDRAALPLPPDLRDIDRLSPYAARLRYGGEDPGTVDRRAALGWAQAAIDWASERIGAEDG